MTPTTTDAARSRVATAAVLRHGATLVRGLRRQLNGLDVLREDVNRMDEALRAAAAEEAHAGSHEGPPLPRHVPDGAAVVFPGGRFSVTEVLQFVAFNKKTGTLKITLPAETLSVDMRKGAVTNVWSDNTPEHLRLGAILVSHGALAQRDLDAYLEENGTSRKRLGRGLLAAGLIGRQQLYSALRFQVNEAFSRALQAEVLSVALLPRDNPYGKVDLRLDLTALLLEATASSETPLPVTGDCSAS